jgi:hypothetical protein
VAQQSLQPRGERPTGPPERQTEASGIAQEWRALDAPVQQAALYRQAGDQYLGAEADPASALRCYTAFLEEGRPEEQNISTDDSWLLMAIKESRQREKNDAK